MMGVSGSGSSHLPPPPPPLVNAGSAGGGQSNVIVAAPVRLVAASAAGSAGGAAAATVVSAPRPKSTVSVNPSAATFSFLPTALRVQRDKPAAAPPALATAAGVHTPAPASASGQRPVAAAGVFTTAKPQVLSSSSVVASYVSPVPGPSLRRPQLGAVVSAPAARPPASVSSFSASGKAPVTGPSRGGAVSDDYSAFMDEMKTLGAL